MIIRLPRGITVDIKNIPDDFDDMIRNCFAEYTKGTRKEYRYQDKLCFIDRCAELLHQAEDEVAAVKQLILQKIEYMLEYDDIPDNGEFMNIDFMCECYNKGKADMELYSKKYYSADACINSGDKYLNDKIMKLLERIIKIVINYEE